jgi:hypothetical protein
MIQPEYQELAMEVKEMLSLIGGNKPFRGTIESVERLNAVRRKEYDAGTFHGVMEDVYHLQPLVIDDENYVLVYKEYNLSVQEAERMFEAWAAHYYEKTIQEL